MLIIFFCILILNFSNVFPSNYCEIKDILTPNDSLLHCNEDQLVFGSFLFDSEDSNLLYTNNSDYNVKIINNFDKEIIFFLDNNCQKKGVKIKDIFLVSLLAAPEGVKNIQKNQKGLHIFTCKIDSKLNHNKFIVPGLGDAGDRYMGT